VKPSREPFWGWPSWRLLRFALALGLGTAVWFALVYVGADALTGWHARRVRLHLSEELRLPFVPVMVLGYLSIYPLFWMAPFILRSRRQIAALCLALAAVTLGGGVCFVLFPAEALFPPPGEMGPWVGPVRFAKAVALRYNLMPSLHVALSTVCVLAYAEKAGHAGRVLLWLWAAVIGLSTLLLHQHYLIDVLTGYALAWAGVRCVYRPRLMAGPGAVADVPHESLSCAHQSR
jgi:membrane-associated phospholipid phosphatase